MNTRKILIPAAILVTLVAFVYLYVGLYQLALHYIRLEPLPAALFPFAVDAATLVFLIAALDKRVKGKHYVFVWSVVAGLSTVSVVAQYIAHPATPDTPLAPWLAAVPAASLIVLTHLLWIIAQDTLQIAEESATVAAKQELLEEIEAAQPSLLDRAVEALLVAREAGKDLTGAAMAEILGLKKENGSPHLSEGRKILKRAQEALDAA